MQESLGNKTSPQPRAAARINPKLEKNLTAYLTAAGAAGVGLLALANPLEAKIVFTPANTKVAFENITPIDLNGDGVADAFVNFGPAAKGVLLYASAAVGNGILLNRNSNAVAGFFGVPVGPGQKFGGSKYAALMYGKSFGYGNASSYVAFGPWVNLTNRYLGVEFQISGKTHFGWVRMTTGSGGPVITGYAYELTPNTAIKEGAFTSPEKVSALTPEDFNVPSSKPASLGMLARGAEGVAIWRRENEVPPS